MVPCGVPPPPPSVRRCYSNGVQPLPPFGAPLICTEKLKEKDSFCEIEGFVEARVSELAWDTWIARTMYAHGF